MVIASSEPFRSFCLGMKIINHTELRMRSICELAKNEKQYLDNNYLLSLTGTGNLVQKLRPSSVNVISKNHVASYRNEV